MKQVCNQFKSPRTLWVAILVAATAASVMAGPVLTSVTVGPQSPDPVSPGSNAVYVVTVNRTGNGNLDVFLTAPGLPAGATATFSPNPVHFVGSVVMSTNATMVVSVAPSTPTGSYPFTPTGTDGASFNVVTAPATLDVGTTSSAGVSKQGDGSMIITWNVSSGKSYCIQATTNLTAPFWVTLCTNNSGTSNLLTFVDKDSPNYPCRFYRCSVAP